MSDADTVVREFCEAWERGDADEIVSYFAEDAVYHNVPMEPLEGKAAIKQFLDDFFGGFGAVVFVTHVQVAAGNVVMNERTDTIQLPNGPVDLPVCGVFELNDDGKIARWSDYFDAATFAGG